MSDEIKNADKNPVPNLETGKTVASKPPVVSTVPRVVRITPISGNKRDVETKPAENSRENFLAASKILEPAVDAFCGIIDGTVVKVTAIVSDAILEDEKKAISLSEKVALSKEARTALKVSGARLIAKRYPESDFMDLANVVAAVGEMGVGVLAVAKELMAIRKIKQEELELKKKS